MDLPTSCDAPWSGTFAIMAGEEAGIQLSTRDRFLADDGADVWADFATDGRLDDVADARPSRPDEAIGAALAATLELAPGETRLVSFVLAWDLPVVEFGAGTCWYKRYTRFFGRSGDNAWAIGAEALAKRTEWSSAIDAWQAPILADTARPDWYKGALFNELYFLVDGGTVWTDGTPFRFADAAEPGGGAADDLLGHFAVLECYDYPFYNTLDVNFYASWALLLLWPDLDVGVVRDFAATVDLDDPEIVTVGWQGTSAQRKRRGALPHDLGAPGDDPFLRPNSYTLARHQHLEGPQQQVRAPGLARCPARARSGPGSRGLAGRRAGNGLSR